MPFDLSAVTAQANDVVERSDQSSGNRFDYPLVYPGAPGTLSVKLLFNPKANSVSRLVYNHKINGVNIPCMRTWNQDCPICKALQDIKNTSGTEHPQLRSTTRAISLAQVVNDKYPLPDGVNVGDIVLLMYPWTVYKDIQQIISQAHNAQELALLIASNEGMVFNITHGNDNRYTTQTDPFARFKTCQSDEEFDNLLNGLKSLNEVYRPSAPTEDQMNTINDAAKELVNTFMGNNIGQPQVPNAQVPQQNVYNPGQASVMPQFNPNPTPAPQAAPAATPNFNVGMPSQDPDIPFNGGVQAQASVPPATPQLSMATQMGFQVPQNNTTFVNPVNAAPAVAPVVPTAPTDTMSSTKPECYGRHGDPSINPDQCAICGFEWECIESSPA